MLHDTTLRAFASPTAPGWLASVRQGNYWYCLLSREDSSALLQQLLEIFADRPLLVRFRQLRVLELLLKSADFSRGIPRYFPALLSDYLSPLWSATGHAPPIPEAFYSQQKLWWHWLDLYERLPAALRDDQAVFHGIQESDPVRLAEAKTHLDAWRQLLAQRREALALWGRLLSQDEADTSLAAWQSRLQAAKKFLTARQQYPNLDFWHSAWQDESVTEVLQELARYQALKRDYATVIKDSGWQEDADYVFRFYRYIKQKPHYFWQEQRAKQLLKKIAVTVPKDDHAILALMGHVIRAQQSLHVLKKNNQLAETLFKQFWQGEQSDLSVLQAIYQQWKYFNNKGANKDQKTENFPYRKLWQDDLDKPLTSVLLTQAVQQVEDFLYDLQKYARNFKQALRWQLKDHAYNPLAESLSPDHWPFWAQEQVSHDLDRAWSYLPLWQEWQALQKDLVAVGYPPLSGVAAENWANILRNWAAREQFMARYRDVGIPMDYQRWQNLQQAPLLLLWPEEDADEDWLPPLPDAYVLYLESGEESDFIIMGLPKLFTVDLARLTAWRQQTPLPAENWQQNLSLPLEVKASDAKEKTKAAITEELTTSQQAVVLQKAITEENDLANISKSPQKSEKKKVKSDAKKTEKKSSPTSKKLSATSKKNNHEIVFPEYVTVTLTLPEVSRFQDYPIDLLAEKISEVLHTEAPIHEALIFKRLRQAAGLSRCGSAVTAQIHQALLWLDEHKGLRKKGDFYYLPTQKANNVPLRNRQHLDKNERNLDWICEEELRLAWKKTKGNDDKRLTETLQSLGFRQATAKLKQQLRERLHLKPQDATKSAQSLPPL